MRALIGLNSIVYLILFNTKNVSENLVACN